MPLLARRSGYSRVFNRPAHFCATRYPGNFPNDSLQPHSHELYIHLAWRAAIPSRICTSPSMRGYDFLGSHLAQSVSPVSQSTTGIFSAIDARIPTWKNTEITLKLKESSAAIRDMHKVVIHSSSAARNGKPWSMAVALPVEAN